MPFHCIPPQEKWMENLNLRLGSSDYMKCINIYLLYIFVSKNSCIVHVYLVLYMCIIIV